MQIYLTEEFRSFPHTLIFPLPKKGPLPNRLLEALRQTGMDADQLSADFSGNAKEVLSLYLPIGGVNTRVLLLGLGERPSFHQVLQSFRILAHKYKSKFPAEVYCYWQEQTDEPVELARWVEASVNGFLLGLYDIGRYKTGERPAYAIEGEQGRLSLVVPEGAVSGLQPVIERARVVAETQIQIFDLVNAPSNRKSPQTLADWAVEAGRRAGFQVAVMNKEEIEAQGMHALLAVNRGSEFPARFIVMDYRPAGTASRTIGLVGKGVTFDTGGLSIKPSANMHYMKSDMGGAAAVLGAMEIAARLALPIRLLGIVPSTDNSVDGLAIKPSDVIGSYSGKTIEVIDTDAEGRLILADGLSYLIRNYRPEVVIDLATLTGSCIRTFGYHAGGLFANDDQLADELLSAGEACGERLWRLPLWEEYADHMKSDIADIKNFSGKPLAGAITAAKFLEFFIDDHPAWAHLDIAGVAVGDSEYATQKSATGFGLRLLLEYFTSITDRS